MIANKIVLFIIYFLIWAFLSWPIDIQHIITGVCVSGLVTFLTGELFIGKAKNFIDVKRYLWFLAYITLSAWECIKGSFLIIWPIVKPIVPENASIMQFQTGVKSEIGITFLANAITLTPGAFCIDADNEKGILYVHCLYPDRQYADRVIKNKIDRFSRILKKIFE
jgi:multicomponent Na+:H+ antiporter subunit E